MPVLSEEERSSLRGLQGPDLFALHPHLILKASEDASSMAELMERLLANKSNTRLRNQIASFLLEHGVDLPNGNTSPKRRRGKLSLEEVLSRLTEDSHHLGSALRAHILRHKLVIYSCVGKDCPLGGVENPTWAGMPLVLELDHINGTNSDNRLENLRFLCANCHGQTETYRGRNVTRRPVSKETRAKMTCPKCGGNKLSMSEQCRSCHKEDTSKQKAEYPAIEELIEQVSKFGYSVVGARLGVSGTAVKKYLSGKGKKNVSKFSHKNSK